MKNSEPTVSDTTLYGKVLGKVFASKDDYFDISILWQRKVLEKYAWVLFLSAIIGYLLSPRIFVSPVTYNEGDVIHQNIVIEEDIMVPDTISTRLKQQKLLQDIRPIYDYDPSVLEKTIQKLETAFEKARLENISIEKHLKELEISNQNLGSGYFYDNQNQQMIVNKVKYYEQYKNLLSERLNAIESQDQVSARDFEKKKRLDNELNKTNQTLAELDENMLHIMNRLSGYSGKFKNLKKTISAEMVKLDQQKEALANQFFIDLQVNLSDVAIPTLDFPFYTQAIQKEIIKTISPYLTQKVLRSKTTLEQAGSYKIDIRNLVSDEISTVDQLEQFSDLATIQAKLDAQNAVSGNEGIDSKGREFSRWLSKQLIIPTVTENKLELEKRKNNLVSDMSSVFFSLKKGEIIARAGERTTQQQSRLLDSYYNLLSQSNLLPRLVGLILIVFSVMSIIVFSFQFREDSKRLNFKKIILIGISIVISMLLVKGGAALGGMMEIHYFNLNSDIYRYFFPVALASMLIGMLINFEAALMTGLMTSLFTAIMMQQSFNYFFFAIMGSFLASFPITKFESRYSIIHHGFKLGLLNIISVAIILLIEKNQVEMTVWPAFLAAFSGGILTAILCSFLLPFFESMFDITTSLKLLELSNMNHPVLKDLIFHAPGTYQHSIVVGNLAEAGATQIDANPLLARVASYYHDVGKGLSPHHFIENQPINTHNIHDEMDPYESVEVIKNHLKNGAEIADKYRLGKDIRDIMLQHHGTNVIKIFYDRALKNSENNEAAKPVKIKDFCYSGPKPQSLEAALVMLADISEASTRSIKDPSPESISKMINKVSWSLMESGQLDESGLTLLKFREVIDVYCNVLISIHHHRLEYPEITHHKHH